MIVSGFGSAIPNIQQVQPGSDLEPGLLVTLESAAHPAKVDIFSDWGSVFHVLLGVFVGMAGEYEFALPIMAGFLGFEVSEAATGESWQRTGGKLTEFALGMMLALAINPKFLKQMERKIGI